MDIVNLIISLVSGAVGGNVAGAAMKDKSLGTAGNSIAGILGGGLGAWILQLVGIVTKDGGHSLVQILEQIASGGVGGGVLLAIIAAIKSAMAKGG